MKLGVLVCDHVQTHLQPQFGDYPDMFQTLFHNASDQVELGYFNVVDGQFPQDIDCCDAYLASGSKFGANDEEQWIAMLEDFVRALYTANKKFIGVCFGHQVLAKALGGRVEKSPKGWGVGIHTSKIVSQKSWMSEAPAEVNLIVSHQDQIVELPEQAEILLSSEFCPNSMIQVGANMLGLQGHPEFSPGYARALMESRRDRIPAHIIDQGLESLEQAIDAKLTVQWLRNFLRQSNAPKQG